MSSSNLIVSPNSSIRWPKWTDDFNGETDYLGLTAQILCGLYDGSCEECQCQDPEKSKYGSAVRAALPHVWPRGPLEMIGQFNQFADMQGMPDRDRVRDPVSSAFAKLTEHAAFWVYVKSVMRSHGIGQPPDPVQPQAVPHEPWDDWSARQWSENVRLSCGPQAGAVSAPAPFTQEKTMASDTINPFGASSMMQAPETGMEGTDQPESKPISTTALVVIGGLGVLFIGGLIAADMYRTSKGIRPVYVSPPMMPMGVYY
jgi:hypothetical protein